MACRTGNCSKQRTKLKNAAKSGNVKETVKVAVEGVRMMVGLNAGKIIPVKVNK